MKFHALFAELYAFLFNAKKPLARKPKPWRISFLLEVAYGGWSLVRDEILAAFSNCKDIEYLTFLNLLDNYILATLCIYSLVFKSNMADEYYQSLVRCWIMFLMFRRRHYDKAPLIALSNVEYWKQVGHPIIISISSVLSAFDEYPVENFHSLLRARTTITDKADRISLKGKEIDSRKHELHDFKSTFVPPRKFAFSRKNIDSLKVKAAEYITVKFANFVQNAGQATKVSSESSHKQRKKCENLASGKQQKSRAGDEQKNKKNPKQAIESEKRMQNNFQKVKESKKKTESKNSNEKKTKWRLPNLFGQKVVSDELLPLGYLSHKTAPDPNRYART